MDAKESSMRVDQQSGEWSLARGELDRLTVGPGERRLEVRSGRLWITVDDRAGGPARDLWLSAGESARFADGERLLLEAWPTARFALLVPPSACARRRAGATPPSRTRRWFSVSGVVTQPAGVRPAA